MISAGLKKYLLLAAFLSPWYLEAQPGNFNFNSYFTDNGFPTNAWHTVMPDSYGFLWLASFDGLYRWDGYSFKKYSHKDNDPQSLDNNIVYSVYEDSHKRLWAGTQEGLSLYDRKQDRFVKCVLKKEKDKIPVNTIIEDRDGQLWLGTSNGLCRYDHSTAQATWFLKGADDDVIWSLGIDAENDIWVGTFNRGLKKFSRESLQFSDLPVQAGAVRSEKIRSILVDKNNTVWVGTEDKGVFILDKTGRVIKSYNNFSLKSPGISNSINCLYQDKTGRIWLGVSRDMLYYIPEGDQQPVPLVKTTVNNNHERITTIASIREDSFGNTWFASGTDGLFSTNASKNVFRNYLQDLVVPGGLKSRTVTCFYEGRDGKIWTGTNGGGVFLFDPLNGTLNRPVNVSMQTSTIRDIKGDSDGSVWIVEWGGGITRYDPSAGFARKYMHDPKDVHSLIFNDAKVVLPDDSIVWVGTHGQGLAAFDKKSGQFISYKNNKGRFPFPMDQPAWINHLFKDSKNRLWISTYSGLFVFDGKDLRHFEHSKDTSALSSNSVNMVAQDGKGTIWVVSEGGLDKYDEANGSFIRCSARLGVPQTLKSIIAGRNNDLWIGSNQGVLLVDADSGKLKIYDTNDGLPDNSFYQKAVMKSRNGDIFFGTNKGFTAFNPDSLRPLNIPAHFYFTDLSVNNQLMAPGIGGPLRNVLAFTDTLRLEPGQSFFTIGFAAINLYAPAKTKYAYQLDGMQEQWIDVKDDRRISFMRLHPGDYTLRIRYTDTDGKWKVAGKALRVIILPPWWQTWWFRLLAFIFISAAIVAVFYARVASIKKRNKLLKLEVAKRTADLHVMNASLIEQYDEICLQKENLEISNEEIKRQTDKIIDQQQHIVNQNHELENTVEKLERLNNTKDYFFSILAHDLKDPVHAITELTGFMKENFKKIERREIEGYIDNMYNASASVYELLINLLNWSRSQSGKITHAPTAWSLREMIEKNGRVLEAQIENKHINLEIHVDRSQHVFADYNMMDTVFRNIINNAVKFTDYNGRIEINSAKNGDHLVIRVTDSGVGIPASQIEKIFGLEKTGVTTGTAGEKGIGLGLVIAKEFIGINKGSIWVESTPEQGTSFYIQVPAAERQSDQQEMGLKENPLFHSRIAMDIWDTIPMEKLVKLKGKKILIVDDNKEVREYLKLILSGTFEIFEASNGRDALQAAMDTPPAVIITDILMPDMNGLDFCRNIKEQADTSHIPVVFLTSQWYEDIQISGYKAGADVYLTKPVKKELLVQVIINLLQNQERMHASVLENILDQKPFYDGASSVNKLDEQFLGQLVSLIEANIANPDLDAKFLSKELATSRTLLYNKIKALTGQTVHEFIKSIRLRKSLKLLLEGNLSISQIAYEVGFNSHSYFDKCFIKQYKMGPKEYVNKNIKKR